VVLQQLKALAAAGHDVRLFGQYTDERERLRSYRVRAAATVATGRGPHPLAAIGSFRPDVVHVHNLFPNMGRRWLNEWRGPIVATMHNFRPMCAAGTFYRGGQVCTDCLDRRNSWPAIQHGCYRGSRMGTLPLAVSTRFEQDPVLRRADRVIVLNPAMRQMYERGGVRPQKLAVVPNFLADPGPPGNGGETWLFVGRLVPEKGIAEVIADWPAGKRLAILGDGPLRETIAQAAPRGVSMLGSRSPQQVNQQLREARGLLFPSRWLEGFPMVYLEAIAAGTPVLAWRPSSVAGMVEQHGTGLVVDDLRACLERADREFPALRRHCRKVFKSHFTVDSWIEAISLVYAEAIGH
jgi:glycosyltransferase involved in cell wall biosynthesis